MRRLAALVLLTALAAPAAAQDDLNLLALQARKVFKTHCQRCHRGEGSESGYLFDSLSIDSLTRGHGDEKPVVVPNQLDASRIWVRMGVKKNMPPKSEPDRPSAADLDAVRRWIEKGAPAFPTPKERSFIATAQTLTAVRDHLRAADSRDRKSFRYFTLTHLHNNPKVEDEELRTVRAALAKAVNSMTWSPQPVPLQPVDAEQTVFAVNIKDLGWDRGRLWQQVLREYPYGLDSAYASDKDLKKVGQDLKELVGDELVHLRADWFSATATRPPLYYHLLGLPQTVHELEHLLKVDFAYNFKNDALLRAGFPQSGVSGQNRLVERHDSPVSNYYWKSYDFKPRTPRANLMRFPLGPVFVGNDYAQQAFDHAGGEMIFGLPNGMQAYYLSDGVGKRIDEGPTDVVSDALKTSGSPAIVNGMSCMHCHKHGMIGFTDVVRTGTALPRAGLPYKKVETLYPENAKMASRVKDDEDRFVTALEKVMGPFLKVAEDAKRPIRDFVEPVGEVTRAYLLVDVDLEKAARELGMKTPADLAAIIRASGRLKELGLLPLAEGKVIKRGDWEAKDGTSLFQDVARELELGTPSNAN